MRITSSAFVLTASENAKLLFPRRNRLLIQLYIAFEFFKVSLISNPFLIARPATTIEDNATSPLKTTLLVCFLSSSLFCTFEFSVLDSGLIGFLFLINLGLTLLLEFLVLQYLHCLLQFEKEVFLVMNHFPKIHLNAIF